MSILDRILARIGLCRWSNVQKAALDLPDRPTDFDRANFTRRAHGLAPWERGVS